MIPSTEIMPFPPNLILSVAVIAFMVLGSIKIPSSELILPVLLKVIGPVQLLVPLIFLRPPELLSPEAAIYKGMPVIVNHLSNSNDPLLYIFTLDVAPNTFSFSIFTIPPLILV
jgi:hypothetical protein